MLNLLSTRLTMMTRFVIFLNSRMSKKCLLLIRSPLLRIFATANGLNLGIVRVISMVLFRVGGRD